MERLRFDDYRRKTFETFFNFALEKKFLQKNKTFRILKKRKFSMCGFAKKGVVCAHKNLTTAYERIILVNIFLFLFISDPNVGFTIRINGFVIHQ